MFQMTTILGHGGSDMSKWLQSNKNVDFLDHELLGPRTYATEFDRYLHRASQPPEVRNSPGIVTALEEKLVVLDKVESEKPEEPEELEKLGVLGEPGELEDLEESSFYSLLWQETKPTKRKKTAHNQDMSQYLDWQVNLMANKIDYLLEAYQ